VGPSAGIIVLATRESNIEGIESDDQFVSTPQLRERLDDIRLSLGIPHELLMGRHSSLCTCS
jgi:hypothetical protein